MGRLINGEQGPWELLGGLGVLTTHALQNEIWAWRLGIPDRSPPSREGRASVALAACGIVP